ncbi:hypothetical protein [Caproicibacterium amylolyticum]|uniref:Uncharacterized protein n=1 Tax=Caproicibacterium amylolyticum TaxID=2766537 RepID=A0A7G9WKC3_9FIRM|nr:hypothetical protein [Caproicibacterium amylolyticum]QNO19135.1 hypothetical protein H6X83_05880 [Caproicibacterium amylolyticum]
MKIKSVLSCVLLVSIMMFCTGCSSNHTVSSSTTSKSKSTSSTTSKNVSSDQTSSTDSEIIPDIPSNIQNFYNNMVKIHDKYKLDFYYSASNPDNISDNDSISINMKKSMSDDDNSEYKLTYYKNDSGNYESSAEMSIDASEIIENHTIKQIIINLFLTVDNKLSLPEASKRTDILINSYTKDSVNSPIYLSNYIIYLSPMDSESKTVTLYLKSRNEIWDNISASSYQNITKQDYGAVNTNKDKKYKIIGTIKDTHLSSGEDSISKDIQTKTVYVTESLKIVDKDNNEYMVAYSYLDRPVLFEKGKKCIVYGTLSGEDNPYLNADKIEITN